LIVRKENEEAALVRWRPPRGYCTCRHAVRIGEANLASKLRSIYRVNGVIEIEGSRVLYSANVRVV